MPGLAIAPLLVLPVQDQVTVPAASDLPDQIVRIFVSPA